MKKLAVAVVVLAVIAFAIVRYARPWLERARFVYALVTDSPPAHLPAPVKDVAARKLADSWGGERSGGRRHEGIDIFAPRGTPVISTTRGLVTRVGTNRLGGQVVWVFGPGLEWHYYAHLDRYGAFRAGDIVNAGDVIGYVGRTGNAAGTPFHLHYGIYRRGAAQNPYPRLTGSLPAAREDGDTGEEGAVRHLAMEELEAGLAEICRAPKDVGVLELIVRRPRPGEREVLEAGALDVREGLVGDSWKDRPSKRSRDGRAHPDMQLNIMSTRVIALISPDKTRWHLAGDQLFVDLDLSADNVPPGTRLQLGSAVVEVTDQPHTGCGKFIERFGADAMNFINSPLRRTMQLRGINARVVRSGAIRVGDVVRKAEAAVSAFSG